ncbi:oligosaccharyl transferase, archaeosortase A system-associated [Chloroflexota bacterium]
MNQSRFPPKLLVGIILAIFFGIALYLRAYLPYDQVFSGDQIKFTGIDAYYHMRLVDNLLHNFPHFLAFDPYTFYPHGAAVGWPPFFDWFLSGIIWIIGLGSPTQHIVDVVGVYFPAILGALTVIPVYFIGKELFGRWAGMIAAGLIAFMPGEFLGRSILGFTDHHVAEILFSTTAVLFLILAIKTASQRQLSLNHIKHREWAIITKPLVYSVLTGIFMGIYLLSWVGALLFVFIISAYFVIQFIINHLRDEPTDYLSIVGTLSWLIALALSLPLLTQTWYRPLYLPSLLIAIFIPLVLNGILRLMAIKKIKRAYYPLILVGLGLIGLVIFQIVNPDLLSSMVSQFGIFTRRGAALTILEVQPLLFLHGNFSFLVAWGNFTTGFFLSFVSLGILIYLIVKQGSADKTILVVWSLLILAATLGQRRFAYYLAVNVALLTGYLSWRILKFISLRRPTTEPIEKPRKREKGKVGSKERQKTGFHFTARQVTMALSVVAVFFLVFYPNIKLAITTAEQTPFTISAAWHDSLSWLKANTPEPFDTPDSYYELYETPALEESFKYPESAYGIMAWWDYGHWITRIGHRIPISNPFQQGASQAAQFFTAQDETSANKAMDDLGARYVIIDYHTATVKFPGIVRWTDREEVEFFEVYHLQVKDELISAIFFYPEYYHSLAARLYNFDGKEVIPQDTTVISYQEKVNVDGKPYKEITSWEAFLDYEAATVYVSSQKSGNYRIVGEDPFVSPVPLKASTNYKLIYSSDDEIMRPEVGLFPTVKIFEYIP